MSQVDMSPRRVWFGFTIPGKKMMAMLLGPDAGIIRRGQSLIELYKDAPYQALLSVAMALHTLPKQGVRFGPALRDLRKPLQPLMLYGAILTDIRDFLKLRFRCKGLADDEEAPNSTIQEGLRTGNLGRALEELETEESRSAATSYLVNYTVSVLDNLSRNTATGTEDFNASIRRLRDLLRAMVRWSYPEWYGGRDHYDQYVDPLFGETIE